MQLKQFRFLDLYLVDTGGDMEWKTNGIAAFGTVLRQAHLFARIRQIEPTLKMSSQDRKRAGPSLAAKRLKRRKKDRAAVL